MSAVHLADHAGHPCCMTIRRNTRRRPSDLTCTAVLDEVTCQRCAKSKKAQRMRAEVTK